MKYPHEQIRNALAYDALAEAESINKDDVGLAFLLMQKSQEAKKHLLSSNNDVWFNCPMDHYINVITDLGFTLQSSERFHSTSSGQYEVCELWFDERRGIILWFDTFRGGMNGGSLHYNFKYNNPRDYLPQVSSSYLTDDILAIRYDCREGVRHHIEYAETIGKFITPWVGHSFLWLLNHMDTKGEYDYDKINYRRLGGLRSHCNIK